VKVPDELRKRLDAAAESSGVTQSELLRRALEAYLEARAAPEGTFGDLASEFCGVGDGPSDLSTSTRHLARYGK
jgi:hypothetical protein